MGAWRIIDTQSCAQLEGQQKHQPEPQQRHGTSNHLQHQAAAYALPVDIASDSSSDFQQLEEHFTNITSNLNQLNNTQTKQVGDFARPDSFALHASMLKTFFFALCCSLNCCLKLAKLKVQTYPVSSFQAVLRDPWLHAGHTRCNPDRPCSAAQRSPGTHPPHAEHPVTPTTT